MKEKLTLLSLFIVLCCQAWSQTITGFVVNEDNEPVIGAKVMESGSRNGTTSNIDGSFILTLKNPEASLIFSFVGYESDSITLSEGELHQVVLKETVSEVPGAFSDYRIYLILLWAAFCVWLVLRTFRGVSSA